MREKVVTGRPHVLGLIVWLVLVIGMFAWTAVSYHSEQDPTFRGEILLRHGLVMALISAPTGWLLNAFVVVLSGSSQAFTTGLTGAAIVWLTCGLGGYVQWFILLPWAWRKWLRRSGTSTPVS